MITMNVKNAEFLDIFYYFIDKTGNKYYTFK